MNCFLLLKKAIVELDTKKSKDAILRQCDKLEYAIKGDIDNVIDMDIQDAVIYRRTTDKQYLDYVNNKNTIGATPAATAYAKSVRDKKNARVTWAVSRGRVEVAREIYENLKAEEVSALAKLNDDN